MSDKTDNYVIIFRAYKRLPDGSLLYARNYGLRAWPIRIPRSEYWPGQLELDF